MALSVSSVVCEDAEGDLTSDYQSQNFSEDFHIALNEPSRNFPLIHALAVAAAPGVFPDIGEAWPQNPTYGLFAKSFKFRKASTKGIRWICTVSYLPLKSGESNTSETSNPLSWPKSYWLEWVEFEEAITQAKNLSQFTGGPGRAALTMGPVVNTAYQEFEEGLFDTVREAVLCVKQNVATLGEVLSIQSSFAGTCNSDTVFGIQPRRLKFLGVESSGELIGNGVKYYERTVRVQLKKTTDRTVNNVGWKQLKSIGGTPTLAPCMVDELQFKADGTADNDENGKQKTKKVQVSEPVFLAMDGSQTPNSLPVTLIWRYLEEVSYASLLS